MAESSPAPVNEYRKAAYRIAALLLRSAIKTDNGLRGRCPADNRKAVRAELERIANAMETAGASR